MTPRWIVNAIDGIKSLMNIPGMWIDGMLYVLLALTGFWMIFLGTDEAAKWVAPAVLFWTKGVIGSLDAGFLALKLYRSTAFAGHVAEQKLKTGNTEFLSKQKENG